MNARSWTIGGIAVLFAAVLGGAWLALRADEAERVAAEGPAPVVEPEHVASAPELEATAERARSQAPPASEIAPDARDPVFAPEPEPATWTHGFVLDLEGGGVGGIEVRWTYKRLLRHATTANDGSFTLPGDEGDVDVVTPGWRAVRRGRATDLEGRPVLLVVGRTHEVAGIVLDSNRAPIDLATVSAVLPAAALARFPHPLDDTREVEASSHASGDDGRFPPLAVLDVAGAAVEASKDGYQRASVAVDATVSTVELVLEPAAQRGWSVRGVVVLANGSPASGARVGLEDAGTSTDERGVFELHGDDALSDDAVLWATLPSAQGASIPAFGAEVERRHHVVDDARLVLGPPPLSITGRIVEADGSASGKWTVLLADPTVTRANMVPPPTLEGSTAGRDVRVESDDAGGFVLEGLLARTYRIQAIAKDSLVKVVSPPIAAGSRDVRIVVPADAAWPKLEGRVVGRDGRGVGGVLVRIRVVSFASGGATSFETSDGVQSAADGAFTLERVPRECVLAATGDDVIDATASLEGWNGRGAFTISVRRRAHFKIEVDTPSAADARFQMLDASGALVPVYRIQSGGWSSSTEWSVSQAQSAALAVSEDAVTIRFVDAQGHVLREEPVHLVPGQITTLRG